MLNIRYILFSILVFFLSNVFAQEQNIIDSLKQVISVIPNNKSKMDALIVLEFIHINTKERKKSFEKAATIAKEINQEKYLADQRLFFADKLYEQGEIDKCIYYYEKSYLINKRINEKESEKGCLLRIAELYEEKNDYSHSIKYYKAFLELNNNDLNAEVLTRIGLLFVQEKKYKQAIIYFKNSLGFYIDISDANGIDNTITNIANVFANNNEYNDAIKYYKKGILLQERLGNVERTINYHMRIGFTYYQQQKLYNSMLSYGKALIISDSLNLYNEKIVGFMNITYLDSINVVAINNMVRLMEINYQTTIQFSNIIISDYSNYTNKGFLIFIYQLLGNIYISKNNYPIAIKYIDNSIFLSHEIGDKKSEIAALTQLSGLYLSLGNKSKSLSICKQALNISREIGDSIKECYSLTSIADIYYDNDEWDLCIKTDIKALKLANSINESLIEALINHKLGLTYENIKEFNKSYYYYKLAYEIYNKEKVVSKLPTILRAIAGIELELKNYQLSKVHILESINISKQLKNESLLAGSYQTLGLYYLEIDSIDLSIEFYNKSLDIYIKNGNNNNILLLLKTLKGIYIENRNYLLAEEYLQKIIELNNRSIVSNFGVLSEKEQELYIKTLSETFMDFNSYALFRKKDNPQIVELVYNNSIRNKGIMLKSSTAMRTAILSSNDNKLIAQYQEWISYKKQISKLSSLPQEKRWASISDIEERANTIEVELMKKSRDFSNFKKLQNISWKDVQQSLLPNEAAIEFIHFKFKTFLLPDLRIFSDTILYCALILKPDSKYPEMIPLFNEKQLQYVIKRSISITNINKGINWLYGTKYKGHDKLYNLIWKPLEESLEGVKNVYISPSGLLHKISFSAIAKEQNVYLSDIYNVQIKTSTGQILNDDAQTISIKDNVNLFGGINYNTDSTLTEHWACLEATKIEVENINNLFQEHNISVNYFTNTTATEEEFKQVANQSNVLHIATHGFFYPDPEELKKDKKQNTEQSEVDLRGGNTSYGLWSFEKNTNPLMRSGLVFAGANNVWQNDEQDFKKDDGVLTAQEVVQIDMRKTDLVVMSACETGLGDIKGSEGVYGLQRAFKMAGVHYMIMSLWKVSDKETQEFMSLFYSKLLVEKDINKAFQETQTTMRQKYDPYYWASFVLIE